MATIFDRNCNEVWPNVGNKSSPIFSESCQKCSRSSFCLEIDDIQNSQKCLHKFWATFVSKFIAKSPNLVTLIARAANVF